MRRTFIVGLIAFTVLFSLTPGVLAWELERPARDVNIDERTGSSSTDGKASVGLGVHIIKYNEAIPGAGPPYDKDHVALRISTPANTREIISYDVSTDETQKTWVYDFVTDGYQTYLANSYLLMDKGHPW